MEEHNITDEPNRFIEFFYNSPFHHETVNIIKETNDIEKRTLRNSERPNISIGDTGNIIEEQLTYNKPIMNCNDYNKPIMNCDDQGE